jgi:hypothetical protein
MPLSASQTAQIFEILGVPQSGSGEVFASLATLFGAEYESYDCAAVVEKINAKLAALTDAQIARVTTLLDRHTAVGASSPLQFRDAGASRGVLADHPAEREYLRAALSNLLGLAVPSGGFFAEAQRMVRGGSKLER